MTAFTIRTQTFEGPLDLLLELIENRKLFINDVSLAKVADDFISYVKEMGNIPIEESAHFILIASTLLLIKSKSLLPQLVLKEEEEGDIRNLELRLKIYKRIKEASLNVQKLFGKEVIFTQSRIRMIEPIFSPDPRYNLNLSLKLLKDIIGRLPRNEKLPKITVKKVLSLEEMINTLTRRVTSQLKMSFREFTKDHKDNKVNVIVSFLAMLELVKQGLVNVTQYGNFNDIEIETKEVGLPKY